MSDQTPDPNPVFGLERHGFEHIPEADRSMTLRDTAFLWIGTNLGSMYWGWNGFNVCGFAAMFAGVVACVLTINAPVFQGPVSRLLDGADLTWIVGFLVGGITYVALTGLTHAHHHAGSPVLATVTEPSR